MIMIRRISTIASLLFMLACSSEKSSPNANGGGGNSTGGVTSAPDADTGGSTSPPDGATADSTTSDATGTGGVGGSTTGGTGGQVLADTGTQDVMRPQPTADCSLPVGALVETPDGSEPSSGTETSCVSGFKLCNGWCVDPRADVGCTSNCCDPCPVPANAHGVCRYRKCDFDCDAGYVLSADGTACESAGDAG